MTNQSSVYSILIEKKYKMINILIEGNGSELTFWNNIINYIPIWLCIVSPAFGGGNNTKKSHSVSSAIHFKIGSFVFNVINGCPAGEKNKMSTSRSTAA